MQKANVFKKFLLLNLVGLTLLSSSVVPVAAAGTHAGIPLTENNRPKFMIERIDIYRNKLVYSYVDDDSMAVKPSKVGVAWFRMDRYVNSVDVANLENFDFLTSSVGAVVTESNIDEWTEVGREGQVIRYEVGQLDQDLKRDPTGKWMYYVRFDNEDGSVAYWNGQVITFTDCVINYNSVAHNMNLVMNEGACVASSYNATGGITYTLDTDARPKDSGGSSSDNSGSSEDGGSSSGGDGGAGSNGGVDGGEGGRTSDGQNGGENSGEESENNGNGNGAGTQGEGVGEAGNGDMDKEAGGGGSGASGGVTGVVEGNFGGGISTENYSAEDWIAAAQWAGVELTSYRGNEVEILSRASSGNSSELEGVMSATTMVEGEDLSDNVASEVESREGTDVDEKDNEVEVPELGDAKKNRIQWWMLPVIGMLTLGVIMWWILPIAKRRKDEDENEETIK